MRLTVHLFVRPRRGAPLEDLGKIPVTPKPVRTAQIEFDYRGRPAIGTVTLIDPRNREKRFDLFPQVHVHLSEPARPRSRRSGARNSARKRATTAASHYAKAVQAIPLSWCYFFQAASLALAGAEEALSRSCDGARARTGISAPCSSSRHGADRRTAGSEGGRMQGCPNSLAVEISVELTRPRWSHARGSKRAGTPPRKTPHGKTGWLRAADWRERRHLSTASGAGVATAHGTTAAC
jgi:hypothetical protein